MPALLALALLLAAASPAADGEADEAEAAALLARAEEHVAEGRHQRAVATYRDVARRHPGTHAAEVAERRLRPNACIGWADLARSGPSSNRLDVVVMGDGYLLEDQDAFDDEAADVMRVFERTPVFEEYFPYLVVRRANVVSEEAGVDGFGREYSTALGGYVTATEAGHVGVDHAAVRAMLAEVPEHDDLAIALVRRGTYGTAGPGVAAVAAKSHPTLAHELGHALAGLQDEYATRTGVRPPTTSAVNVSDTDDPARVPWAHFLAAGVRGVGVYEGADGRVRGAWKPTSKGCIMGEGEFFCPVCREAIVLAIHARVDPIDRASPDPFAGEIRLARDAGPLELRVRVLRPASHALEVTWWVLPADEAPRLPRHDPEAAATGRRAARGPLVPLAAEPTKRSSDPSGEHELTLRPRDLAPGTYVVVCRAVDDAKLRGERWPWVLKDERELLKSERWWRVVVE